MKRAWNVISNIVACLVVLVAVGIMVFTVVSVTTFDRNDRTLLGYKMFVVLSDSMSATNFKAGDLIFVKEAEPETLKEGDIISYISEDPDNYGMVVTHKIRQIVAIEEGNLGFVTYGTTTGMDDPLVVSESNVVGRYQMRIPAVGAVFSFLKTVPGYLLFVLLPFMVLIIWRIMKCVRLFKEYKKEELAEIVAQRETLKEEQEIARRMLEQLDGLKEQLDAAGISYCGSITYEDFDEMCGTMEGGADDGCVEENER